MVRAPCCEKMGLNKGPWTPQEDQLLISFIQQNGHGNWRALPKLAGLSRCGKSCRLRWTNYLRPDIKRGNFSKEEEDNIIHLHEMLGNRWSAIAAKLPGRTDNEIKNVWHTHLKKKLKNYQPPQVHAKRQQQSCTKIVNSDSNGPSVDQGQPENPRNSPQRSTSELSSVTYSSAMTMSNVKQEQIDSSETSTTFPEIDESFWTDELKAEGSELQDFDFGGVSDDFQRMINGGNVDDGMDFWYNLFIGGGELPELPEF